MCVALQANYQELSVYRSIDMYSIHMQSELKSYRSAKDGIESQEIKSTSDGGKKEGHTTFDLTSRNVKGASFLAWKEVDNGDDDNCGSSVGPSGLDSRVTSESRGFRLDRHSDLSQLHFDESVEFDERDKKKMSLADIGPVMSIDGNGRSSVPYLVGSAAWRGNESPYHGQHVIDNRVREVSRGGGGIPSRDPRNDYGRESGENTTKVRHSDRRSSSSPRGSSFGSTRGLDVGGGFGSSGNTNGDSDVKRRQEIREQREERERQRQRVLREELSDTGSDYEGAKKLTVRALGEASKRLGGSEGIGTEKLVSTRELDASRITPRSDFDRARRLLVKTNFGGR